MAHHGHVGACLVDNNMQCPAEVELGRKLVADASVWKLDLDAAFAAVEKAPHADSVRADLQRAFRPLPHVHSKRMLDCVFQHPQHPEARQPLYGFL